MAGQASSQTPAAASSTSAVRLLRGSLLAGALLAVGLGSCGGQKEAQVKTVTVEASAPESSAPSRRTPPRKNPARITRAAPSTFVQCDSNIEAKAGTTTCGFAQNAFWHYWTSGRAASIQVYSPATQSTFATTCTTGAGRVVCTTSDDGAVKFAQAAVDVYSQAQADAYASNHDLGPDPYETLPPSAPPSSTPETPSIPEAPPTPGGNIPNYENGNGYRVQCEDGMYSQSGGIQGACSGHGGVR
jgi:hypothetical protein